MRFCNLLQQLAWLLAALITSSSLATLCSQWRDLSDDIGHDMSILDADMETWCDAVSGTLHYSWHVERGTELYRQIDLHCYNSNNTGGWVIVKARSSNSSAGSAVYSVPPLLQAGGSQATCSVRGCYLIAGRFTEYLTNTVTVNCSLPADVELTTDTSLGSFTSPYPTSSTSFQATVQVTQYRGTLSPSHMHTHSRITTPSTAVPVATGRPIGQQSLENPSFPLLLMILLPVVAVVLIVIATLITIYIVCHSNHRNNSGIILYIFKETEFDSSLMPSLRPFACETTTPYHSQHLLCSEDKKEKRLCESDDVIISQTDPHSAGCESCSGKHKLQFHISCETSSNDDDATCDDDTLGKSVYRRNSGPYTVQNPLLSTASNTDDSDNTAGGGGVGVDVERGGEDGDDQEYRGGREDRTDDVVGHFQFYELPSLSCDTPTSKYQMSSSGYVTGISSSVFSPLSPSVTSEYLQIEPSIHREWLQSLHAEVPPAVPHVCGSCSDKAVPHYPNRFLADRGTLLSNTRQAVTPPIEATSSKTHSVCHPLPDTEYDFPPSEVAVKEECFLVSDSHTDLRLSQMDDSTTLNSEPSPTFAVNTKEEFNYDTKVSTGSL